MRKFLEALGDTFLDINGGTSCKRIFGCIGYICGIVMAFQRYDEGLVTIIIGSACSLMLGTVFEKQVK